MRIYYNEANGLLNIGDHTSILGLGIHVSSRDGNVWIYSAGISDAEFSAPYTQIKDINGDGFASEQECIDYILAQGAMATEKFKGEKGDTGLIGYNASGLISSPLKIWLSTVTTDDSGQLDINYSAAGFTAPPKVSVEAHSIDTATEQDRAWATLRGSPTASGAKVYTIRGNIIVSILLGGGVTVRTAPNTKVDVMAIGI